MRSTIGGLAVALCLVASTAWGAKAALRTISTSGESVVYVAPDEVIVNFGVETTNADLEKAKSTNDQAAARLVKAVKELGVEDKYIQTDNLTIDLRYNPNRDLEITGYTARRSYSVTLKDPKKFETLVSTAIKSGANRLMGFEFRTTELRKHRDKARSMAIVAAKEKATALAGELTCKVGRPQMIQEGGGYYAYGGGRWGWGGGFNSMAQNSVQAAPAAAGGEGDGETMPLGQIAVRANVTVTFDLETE